MEPEFAQFVGSLFTLYILIGLVAAGFAMMLGGPVKFKSTARLFFWRPIELLFAAMWSGFVGVLKWMLGIKPKKKKKKKKH